MHWTAHFALDSAKEKLVSHRAIANSMRSVSKPHICDGGGTFMGLATELKNKNVGKLHLFTTFGIYSKGIEILTKYFDGIWCSNGFSTYITDSKNQSKFNQIPINYEIYPY